jgi:hypothetical protein
MYNAAISGQLDANGNIRQISDADNKKADEIIQSGFAKGSLDGFGKALSASRSKMGTVLQSSINAQNKQVWNLFGVGDKYKSPEIKQDPITNISDYGIKHPEQQVTILKMYDDVKSGNLSIEDINNWVNQQQ